MVSLARLKPASPQTIVQNLLTHSRRLQKLALGWTKIDMAALAGLLDNVKLKSLDVSGHRHRVTDDGRRGFPRSIP